MENKINLMVLVFIFFFIGLFGGAAIGYLIRHYENYLGIKKDEGINEQSLRNNFREMVKYLLKNVNDKEVIEAYTDTFMFGAKEYAKSEMQDLEDALREIHNRAVKKDWNRVREILQKKLFTYRDAQ